MPSNSAPSKPIVRLRGPEDLLAAVPGLLGYVPERSLVLVAVGPRGHQVSKCVRCDLPPPEHVPALAEQLVAVMAQDQPSSVDLIVVGGEVSEDGVLPLPALASALRRGCTAVGIDLAGAYWVASMVEGAPWRSYLNKQLHGVLPDPASSHLSAELTGLGLVTFGSRAELEALFLPDAEALLERRSQLIDRRIDDLADWTPERGVAAVRAAVQAAAAKEKLALTDEQVADLAIALVHGKVRDSCLATALPSGTPVASAAARVWQALSRALPAPERAEAACLAAFAAYQSGDGTLARIALDVALDANPTHVLSSLLDRALLRGMHPEEIKGLAMHDEVGLCAQLRVAA